MASAPQLLEARGIGVVLGGRAILDDVSFALEGARRTLVLGANGSGKSVLLRTLHRLIAPTRGEVRWHGGRQAMVFQRPVMLRRSARANLTYALAVARVPRVEREARADRSLARVGLADLAASPARVLSGGEQQRLALARAWSLEPALLLLDEPTASLDPAASAEIERVVREIHAAGSAIVMTTHNLGQARRLADDILLLHQGRLAELTPADEFFRQPRSAEGAAFLEGELPWR